MASQVIRMEPKALVPVCTMEASDPKQLQDLLPMVNKMPISEILDYCQPYI